MTDALDGCVYEQEWADQAGYIWVCQIHHNNSKHDVDGNSHLPCLTVDPYDNFNVFVTHGSSPAPDERPRDNPIEGGRHRKPRGWQRDIVKYIHDDRQITVAGEPIAIYDEEESDGQRED